MDPSTHNFELNQPKDDAEVLLFAHIPKTAGTTLRQVINRQYLPDAIYTIGDEPPCLEAFQALSPEESRKIKFIMGHQKFGLHRLRGLRANYMTMFRSPVERVISHYHWIRAHPGNDLNAEVSKMQLEDFAVSGLPHATNQQTEFTSGLDNPQDATAVRVAQNNLDLHFKAFGIVEHFDESLLLFKRVLGWRNIYYFSSNVASDRPRAEDLPRRAIELIRKHNGPDLELYEFAKARFAERIRQQGPWFHQRLKLFRLRNRLYRKNLPNSEAG